MVPSADLESEGICLCFFKVQFAFDFLKQKPFLAFGSPDPAACLTAPAWNHTLSSVGVFLNYTMIRQNNRVRLGISRRLLLGKVLREKQKYFFRIVVFIFENQEM